MKYPIWIAACVAGITLAGAARSQDYPTKPITMVVPFAAGGGTDVIARLVAEEMSTALGQRVIIENVPGAGGTIGVVRVARAATDGYTLLAGHTGTNAAAYSLYKTPKYDPRNDFEPIGLAASSPIVVIATKDLAASNAAEFATLAKAKGPELKFAHSGIGSLAHLTCTLFNQLVGASPTQVTYRGNGPLTTDLMAGHVDYSCDQVTVTAPQISGGTAKGITIAGDKRSPIIPEVQTSAEAGLPKFDAMGWVALFAPKGTSPEIMKKLNQAYRKALESPKVQDRFRELGAFAPEPAKQSQAYLAEYVASEVEGWGRVIKASGVFLD
jgi:tripartite-type tricarboxylate transporter receptor subunit TctC